MYTNHGNIGKIIAILSAIAVGVSVIVPFIQITVLGSTLSLSLADGDAWIEVVIIAGLGLVFAWLEKDIGTILCGVAGIGYMVYKYLQIDKLAADSELSQIAAALVKQMAKLGFGFYLMLIGSIGLVIGGIVSSKSKFSVDPNLEVYWVSEGSYYHSDINCKSLDGIEAVVHSTALEAQQERKKPCPLCVQSKKYL